MAPSKVLQLSEAFGKPLPNLSPVHEILSNAAQKHGSSTAIVCMHQKSDFLSSLSKTDASKSKYLRWTFDELLRASHAFAMALAADGIKPGQLIAAYVTCGIEFHIIARAALELNCPFSPLNPKTTKNEKETQHYFSILKPAVVVVPDKATSENLAKSTPESIKQAQVLLVCNGLGDHAKNKWQDFCTFVAASESSPQVFESLKIERKMDDVVLVMFTSGTTSMPKGVPHTNKSWASIIMSLGDGLEIDSSSVSCNHTSLFHIFGINFFAPYHAKGAKVVHPAAWYDAGADLAAIRNEGITDVPGVPAMMAALVAHPDFEKTDTSGLKRVLMGATTVLPEHLRLCKENLKVEKPMDGFGTTETGVPWCGSPEQTFTDSYPTAGTLLRVCNPETGEVLQRGTPGELHQGGTSVISRYWLSENQDSENLNSCFYDDDHGHWMKTGDQAVVASESGEFTIIGRYKDLIIRGGENIAPSAIESVLAEQFNMTAEVVGIPDVIAGEVPVAIIKGEHGSSFQEVHERTAKKLGDAFVIEDMILLKDLGISDFPKTPSGKVKKNELRDLVVKYLEQKENEDKNGNTTNEGQSQILQTLLKLWSQILGIDSLSSETSIHDYADSLVLSRFSAKLRRTYGHSLSLQQLLDHPTIAAQADLLSSSTVGDEFSDLFIKHEGPPEMHQMAHTSGNPEAYETTKKLSQEVLNPLGLSWQDVQDVLPMQDHMEWLLLRQSRRQSSNHRHAWLCRGRTVSEVEAAVKSSLTNHPVLRSMAIKQAGNVLLIVPRPTDVYFSNIISLERPVANTKELDLLYFDDPKVDHVAYPGPLIKMMIAEVQEENCPGILYLLHHALFDAISFSMWTEDLDTALAQPKMQLEPRIPYKTWTESYQNLRGSKSALQSIEWNVNRLSGISKQEHALFPVPRAPGWFRGCSDGWVDKRTGKPGSKREPLDDFDALKGASRQGKLYDVQELKTKHLIETPQIAKAALAIVTTRHTGADVAFFGQSQAGRTWPFLSDWQAARMPPAMDVDGPCLQVMPMRVFVKGETTVIEMLEVLQKEQVDINKYCYAPYFDLLERLNAGDGKDGDMAEDTRSRQVFNWLPPGDTQYKCLERISTLSRADIGVGWNFTMPKPDVIQVGAWWDGCQLTVKEVEGLLEEICKMTEQLTKKENWRKKIRELQ